MIAYIRGKLVIKDPTYVIIEAGGLGYHIRISLQTYSALAISDEVITLHTHLSIKEDSHTLFGFFELDEKELFVDLISVSGIGPGTAMVMLSSLSASEIKQAIATEDVRTVQSIKGIGAKTAARAVIELKDKFRKDQMIGGGATSANIPSYALKNEALAALTTLGIARNVAEKSIETILKKEGFGISLENLIKLALR
ncbi:MAG: Holliday junction branch migration protein RuvA [Bacteroidota bacterium]